VISQENQQQHDQLAAASAAAANSVALADHQHLLLLLLLLGLLHVLQLLHCCGAPDALHASWTADDVPHAAVSAPHSPQVLLLLLWPLLSPSLLQLPWAAGV
jgi:hypothetical protein